MRCFYSEYIKIVYFSLWFFSSTRKRGFRSEKLLKHFQQGVMWAVKEEKRFRKCEFELLKCENIMRFFHWIHSHFTAITFLLSFFASAAAYSAVCLCCFVVRRRKYELDNTHKREKKFILFLTKLTSILFLPFYSNIIKAVKVHDREWERRKTICYSVSF